MLETQRPGKLPQAPREGGKQKRPWTAALRSGARTWSEDLENTHRDFAEDGENVEEGMVGGGGQDANRPQIFMPFL